MVCLKKKLFVLFSLFLFILLGCSSGASEYRESVISVSDDILSNSADVEGILEQYSRIWRFSIESRAAIPIDDMMTEMGLERNDIEKHFSINTAGNIPDDFSLNLFSLKSYFEDTGELGRVEQKSRDIKDMVSELNDPPKGYEKVFDELLDLYNLSEKYLEMALDPSGSMQSFNEEKIKLSSDILSQHKRMEVIIPSE